MVFHHALKAVLALAMAFNGQPEDLFLSDNRYQQSTGDSVGRKNDHFYFLAPPGQQSFSKDDYYVSINPTTYFEAQKDCKRHFDDRSDLVSIETEKEYQFIMDEVINGDTSATGFFTSGMYRRDQQQWVWSNGEPFAPWLTSKWQKKPTSPTSKSRVNIYWQSQFENGIFSQENTEQARYVCERYRGVSASRPEDIVLGDSRYQSRYQQSTGTGYVGSYGYNRRTGQGHLGHSAQGYSKNDYYVSINPTTYFEAQKDCKKHFDDESGLVSIETEEEYQFIMKEVINGDTSATGFFTSGMYIRNKNQWVWSNGVPFAPWLKSKWQKEPTSPTSKSRVNIYWQSEFENGIFSQENTEQARYVCERYRSTIPIPCYKDNDMVIVLDSSGSIGAQPFQQGLSFVAELAEVWKMNGGNRVGVTTFSSTVQTRIPLQNNLTPSQIVKEVMSIPYTQGGTRTDLALDQVLAQLRASPRGVPQNIVVLTDGESNEPARTIVSARAVKNAGVRSFSVGIGNAINQNELVIIAGDNQSRVYNAKSFETLVQLLTPVSIDVCNQRP